MSVFQANRANMLTEDYVMRMISQAVAALLKAIGLKKAGRYQEALQAIDQALEQLMGLKANLIKQLDEASLLKVVTFQDRLDTDRLAIIADLLREEGEIFAAQKRPAESRSDYLRALTFYLEVAWNSEATSPPEINPKIEALYQELDNQTLPEDTRFGLVDYYEQLLKKTDHELAKGNLSRQTLEKSLAELRANS